MTIDPKTVQQLATEHILDDARRAHDIGADVLGHFGPDALTKAEYHAYCDAIREAIQTATVAVSWPARPDEQPPTESEPLRDEYGIRADYLDTTSAEFTVADNLGNALEALAEFDAKHGDRVVSRTLIQRKVGDWHDIEGGDRG